ncbi:MAG: hypothetical protein M0C28_17655 [Candidatus Moduliflexus flocculans]|nr:hypothetical protein [Candidatus Moduliflexus flocculans]
MPRATSTEFQYDRAGNKTTEARYYAKANAYTGTQTLAQLRPANTAARVTVTAYDGANQVTSVTTLPDNTVTVYAYDNAGQLISTTAAYGTGEARTQQARYDRQGRITQELSGEGSAALAAARQPPPRTQIDAIWNQYGLAHSYDAAGRRISTTDANGHQTLFYYDASGRLTHTVNALGEVTETRYNAFGEAEATRRYTNRISTAGLTGGLLAPDLQDRLAAIADAATDRTGAINYTLRGAVRQALDALGNTTSNTYNAFGERAS